jgi:ATP-dependent protease ClpP protease subunit
MPNFTYSMTANDDEEDNDEKTAIAKLLKRKPYQQYEQTFTAQQIHFYLSDDIGEPSEYTDMIHRISYANPADIIFIHLNTSGGHLDTGVQIINAMQNSQAKIVTVLESVAYSLGTLIFLAGDQMVVNDNCMMMFHNFRGGVIGKGNELISQLDATVKWFSAFAKKIYVPFLSEDEFTRLLKGEDIWMHSPDIRKRLDKMVKQMQEEPVKKPRKKKEVVDTLAASATITS